MKNKKRKLNLKAYEFPESSNIAKLEYDKEHEVMITTFTSGKRYQYEGINKDLFRQIRRAESVGSAHHRFIVAAGFEGKMLEQ